MGWVSTLEDIEDLRAEHEHYQRGIDNLIAGLSAAKLIADARKAEEESAALSRRLINAFEKTKARAQLLFDEAVALLRDPQVKVVARLNKRTRERDALRLELKECRNLLNKSRISQHKLQYEIQELKAESNRLRAKVKQLTDDQSWEAERRSVRPLRKK
jgi:hypothetical protein